MIGWAAVCVVDGDHNAGRCGQMRTVAGGRQWRCALRPVLTVVTGFFGQNWTFIPYGSLPLFWLSMVVTVFIAAGLVMYFRGRGWL